MTAVWAARAITPDRTLERARVVCRDGLISELAEGVEPRPGDQVFEDGTLVPGLVDLQVNGGDGASFDAREATDRERAAAYHLRRGTTSLLATLVSAPLEHALPALERLAGDVRPDGPVVGLHVEGPFLAQAKTGAHDRSALCDPTPERVGSVLAAAGGALRLLTLAPERPGATAAIERLVGAGVVVAAGHSCAGLAELRGAVDAGLSFMTHVGNASDWPSRPYDPDLGYRRSEPGMVGGFLVEPRLRGSLILDGRHLHPELVRVIVQLKGPDAVVLVSDATPAAGLGPGRHAFGPLEVVIHPAGYATAGEGLAGSTIALVDALRLAVEQAALPLEAAIRMATATPADVIGAAGKGRLAVGLHADLLVLDRALAPKAVYRGGARVDA